MSERMSMNDTTRGTKIGLESVGMETSSSSESTKETTEASDQLSTNENYCVDETFSDNDGVQHISIPIVGYEVTEAKEKFTVFKLKIDNKTSGECWYVFRRYTDFVRLHSQLKTEFPNIKLILPKKKWFGNNFNPEFLEERIDGLQDFIDCILYHKDVCVSQPVKAFFCLDEPPVNVDTIEDARAIMEALEETIFHLRRKLKQQEIEHVKLQLSHSLEIKSKLRLTSFIQECTKECESCARHFSQIQLDQNENV